MKALVIDPEELMFKIKNWFIYKRKVAFLCSFMSGILIYFGTYSKGLTNPDGLWNSVMKISGAWEISLGRYMLPIVDMIRGDAVAYILYSLITIAIFSLAIVWLLDCFETDSSFWNGALAILIMSNQLIGTIITYYYCSMAYAIGFAFSVYAARMVCYKIRNCYGKWQISTIIKGWICIIISLGCYQSYIGVVGFLLLCVIFTMLFEKETNWKKIGIEVLQAIVVFAGGVAGYWICMQMSLKLNNISLADYKGADSIGLMESVKTLPETFGKTYETFLNYYFSNLLQVNGKLVMLAHICIFLLAGLVAFVHMYQWKKKERNLVLKTVMAIVMVILIPPVVNMVLLAAPGTSMNLLMTSGMLVVLPVFAVYSVKGIRKWNAFIKPVANWFVLGLLVLIIRNNVLVENTTQLALEEIYNKTYTLSVRILDCIEKTPGYEEGMKVCIDSSTDEMELTEEFARGSWIVKEGAFWNDYEGTVRPWEKFFSHELGAGIEFVSQDEYEKIIQSETYKGLNTFPKEGCTTIINEVVVIKLKDIPTW